MSNWQPILSSLQVFFDLLKGIAWPVAALAIAVVFRGEIKAILPRVRRAGPSGIELDSIDQQQKTPAPPTDQHVNLSEATPTIEDLERRIRGDLDNVILERREPMLIRQLATTQAAAFFENTYGLIFGSQIDALRRLNSIDSITVDEARNYFENTVRPKFPDEYRNTSFDAWSSFLVTRGFIALDLEKVAIKELGREFLTFLESRNLPLNKAL